jgi:hypothetical protein
MPHFDDTKCTTFACPQIAVGQPACFWIRVVSDGPLAWGPPGPPRVPQSNVLLYLEWPRHQQLWMDAMTHLVEVHQDASEVWGNYRGGYLLLPDLYKTHIIHILWSWVWDEKHSSFLCLKCPEHLVL